MSAAVRGSYDRALESLDERQRLRWIVQYEAKLWKEVLAARRLTDCHKAARTALELTAAAARIHTRESQSHNGA